MKRAFILLLSIFTLALFSCAIAEPSSNPGCKKIIAALESETGISLPPPDSAGSFERTQKTDPIPAAYQSALDREYGGDYDSAKIAECAVREDGGSHTAVFRLTDENDAPELESLLAARFVALCAEAQDDARALEVLNNAEVRAIGAYVYYADSGRDAIFTVIESQLSGGHERAG